MLIQSFCFWRCCSWVYICLTATAINILNHHVGTFDRKENTIGAGHSAFIASAVEVVDRTFGKMPNRTYGHIYLIITTKDTIELDVSLEGFRIQTH